MRSPRSSTDSSFPHSRSALCMHGICASGKCRQELPTDYSVQLSREDKRIIIVGGPRTGKSSLAETLRPHGYEIFCGDPLSKVKEPRKGVTYLPEDLDWSEGSAYVADHWFSMQGPFVLEGQIMARALRKYAMAHEGMPADRIFVLTNHHPL